MATTAVTTTVINGADNAAAVTLAAQDLLYVGQDGSVIATGVDSDGVRGGRASSIMVTGEVFGTDDGIQITTNPTFQSGKVTVGNALAMVSGGSHAIHMTGLGGTVVNAGMLMGDSGIWFEQGSANVVNHGYIQANSAGGEAVRFSDGDNHLLNTLLISNSGANAIVGGAGADSIVNKAQIVGNVLLQDGDDRFDNRGDVELVDGGLGNDTLISLDTIFGTALGGEGDDYLRGFHTLNGGAGEDKLFGHGTDDQLAGGAGRDIAVGDTGSDHYQYAEAGNTNFDHIRNFGNWGGDSTLQDVFELDHSYFKAIPVGELSAAAFFIGAAATAAEQRIIFDDSTGTVWYDKDGNGSASAARIAIIDSYENSFNAHLTNTNFVIV